MTRRWFICGLVLLPLVVSSSRARAYEDDTDNFRPDVLACEEAAAWLEACCPDFDPRVLRCVHTRIDDSSSCGYNKWTVSEDPAITTAESACILERSCDQLVDSGVCTRARRAEPERSYYRTTEHGGIQVDRETSSKGAPVCP